MVKYTTKLSLGILMSLALCACETLPEVSDRTPNSEAIPKVANSTGTNSTDQQVLSLSENRFDWPVDSARLSRGFIPNPTGRHHRPHYGIDLAGPKGTPIYSAQDGVVIYTGSGFKGFGKMIMIEGKNGYATLYAHLSKIKVEEGQDVNVGTEIGAMGRTGRATGVHLHFEVRHDRDPVNPMDYLPAVRVADK